MVDEIRQRDDPLLGIVFAWRFAEVLPAWLGRARRLGEYLELASEIWKQRSKRYVLVREFSTYLIFLTILLVFPIRHRCVLLVAHNVQTALSRPHERWLLSVLNWLGVRFACLESDEGIRQVLGISNAIVFPHPIAFTPDNPLEQAGDPALVVVGVAGDLRPEKGLDKVIPALSHALNTMPGFEFRLGTSNVALAQAQWPATTIHDTRDQNDYMAFLKGLDILVLSYPEETYRYRASGVIAEATGCRTAVICTDVPCLRAQVLSPAKGGAVLHSEEFASESLLDAIRDLATQKSELLAALNINAHERHAPNVVNLMLAQLQAPARSGVRTCPMQ